jgi:hypothetical protein
MTPIPRTKSLLVPKIPMDTDYETDDGDNITDLAYTVVEEPKYFGTLCGGSKSRRISDTVYLANLYGKYGPVRDYRVFEPYDPFFDDDSESEGEEDKLYYDPTTMEDSSYLSKNKKVDEESCSDDDWSDGEIRDMYAKVLNRGRVFMSRSECSTLHDIMNIALITKQKDVIPTLYNTFTIDKAKGVTVPLQYKDIAGNLHAADWYKSCDVEINCLLKNGTWEVVDLPAGRKVVESRWVFRLKLDKDGNVKRFKARFVVKGFSQVYGMDYTDTYAPVVGTITLRMVLSIAAAKGWTLTQLDVETAFLNSPVTEEIYVRQPEGYHVGGPNTVLKLKKSLYGLKQAPFNWNKMITEYLVSLGLQQSLHDECLFTARNSKGEMCIVTVYVDDLLITGDWMEMRALVKGGLFDRFSMSDEGATSQLLGMVIEYDHVSCRLKIHQATYVDAMLERFMSGVLTQYATPAETNTYQQVEDFIRSKKEPIKTDFPYREAVGSLMYLACMTRPDISNIVRYCARFMNCFHELHVKFVKRIFGYLRGTRSIGLVFTRQTNTDGSKLVAYSDASYSDDYFTGRSTVGTVLLLNGGPVMWQSSLLKFVTSSSTHSEFGAMSNAGTAIEHAQLILADIFNRQLPGVVVYNDSKTAIGDVNSACEGVSPPTELFVDNMAAIHIGTNDRGSKRAKHINVRFMNVRDMVLRKVIKLTWISTEAQVADILTKCLRKDLFIKFRQMFMSG